MSADIAIDPVARLLPRSHCSSMVTGSRDRDLREIKFYEKRERNNIITPMAEYCCYHKRNYDLIRYVLETVRILASVRRLSEVVESNFFYYFYGISLAKYNWYS